MKNNYFDITEFTNKYLEYPVMICTELYTEIVDKNITRDEVVCVIEDMAFLLNMELTYSNYLFGKHLFPCIISYDLNKAPEIFCATIEKRENIVIEICKN